MKRYLSSAAVLICLFLVQGTTSAQTGRGGYDFRYIEKSNPWLKSSNAAGLRTLGPQRTSIVEAGFSKDNGNLTGLENSDDRYAGSAGTESYIRISDRMAFYGRLSYLYDFQNNAGEQVLMEPSSNPVNFMEWSDSTRGTRQKELYGIEGGLSYSFNEPWSIGFNISYDAGGQAKRKDPRYLSERMDMKVSFGARFAPSEGFELGFNAIYKRNVERITGKSFAEFEDTYYTFMDYGAFYGKLDRFGSENGYVPKSGMRPVFNQFYGGAVQISAGKEKKVFNELKVLRRTGYFGNKASDEVVYFENRGLQASYDGTVLLPSSDRLHRISLHAGYELLRNFENTYKLNTEQGEMTEVIYFGQKGVKRWHDIDGRISYTGCLGTAGYRPEWEFGADISVHWRGSQTIIYPFFRKQSVLSSSLRLYGKKNFSCGDNLFTIGAEALLRAGDGNRAKDEVLAETISGKPKSADLYLKRDFEYRTAAGAGAGLDFRYTRMLRNRDLSVFIEAEDRFTSTFRKPEFLKDGWRNCFSLSVGFVF